MVKEQNINTCIVFSFQGQKFKAESRKAVKNGEILKKQRCDANERCHADEQNKYICNIT